jgi:hypothetical protein
MAGATGARAWLQAHHLTWLTPQRLRAVTIALFVVATLVPTVVLSGSTPTKPTHAAPSQAVTQHR